MVEKRKTPAGRKYAVIVARFNEFITSRLLAGCLDELAKQGVGQTNIKVVWVPGAFEIPLAALRCARSRKYQAVICLGAVIRGETYHFELVAQAAAQGIARVALQTGKPVIFGVITTDTVNQAYKRVNEKGDHKGREAAAAAVEMVGMLAGL